MKELFRLKALLPALILFSSWNAGAQDDFYDISTIQQIEIHFTQSNWDYIMDTAKAGSGSYLMAQWVKINGIQYDSAGIKYKGSSSYDPTYAKNPLHISLDEFKSQSYQGIASIKLANFYGDPSMIREPLAYSILANYMDCSRSNFAEVTINGNFMGLYANDESVNKKFCSTHFYSSGNTFIKGSPVLPGPYSKSNLKYISADSSAYFGKYELESDYGWNDLVELCDITSNLPSALSATLDIDRALWMLAFNNVLVSLDSYSGWFSQNHYLYKDNTDHYNPVIWDLNMSFGAFPFAGTQNGGSGSLTVDDMKQLNPLLHDNQNDWPLIFNLLSNPTWKSMYIAHMRTIIEENFANADYLGFAGELTVMIANSVQLDPNKFFTYEQFLESMTTDITFGSYVIPGIENLMEARVPYLLATDVFSDIPPVITNVVASNQEPDPGDNVTINATVTGSGSLNVLLGIRHDKEEKFVRQQMFDDGNHNDGAAGDGNFGASFTMSSLTAHYYIYAEIDEANVFAAAFSPERAEHEFYSLSANVPIAEPGDVGINEFLAKNNLDTINEFGNHEDWIELVNLTNQPVDLFGLYLTDDYTNPDKFAFPESTIIQPGNYLIVWADEEDTLSAYLHANFKLSASGEALMLSDGTGVVLDSLTFGPQIADISLGRCPDGTGLFGELDIPTFNYTNYCPEGYPDLKITENQVIIAPNPFSDHFMVLTDITGGFYVEVYDASGSKIFREFSDSPGKSFQVTYFSPGIYFYLVKDKYGRILSSGKMLKL
jgi:hypothetical protein